jgi:hypothetical protein
LLILNYLLLISPMSSNLSGHGIVGLQSTYH